MESGLYGMQSGGGPGRNQAVGPPGRSTSTALPSYSSSAVSTPSLGFDYIQQEQFLPREENEALLAYPGSLQGVMGGGNFAPPSSSMQLQQQPSDFIGFAQQHGVSQIQAENQKMSLGMEQPSKPEDVAYLPFLWQAACMKRALGMQPQQQAKMGMVGSASWTDQSAWKGNLKAGQQPITGPMQAVQNQQGIRNMTEKQLTLAAQLQSMLALALAHNIDLSPAASTNLMAELLLQMQTRMVPLQNPSESNMGAQSSPVQGPKQYGSSSDVSGQSGSVPSLFGSNPNAAISNTNNIPVQQFSVQGRESQVPPRQAVVIGNGMSPMHPPQQSANMSQGVDHRLHAKNTLTGQESLQMQYYREFNRSFLQSVVPPNDGGLGNHFQSQGGLLSLAPQQCFGFTKQQLQVLKAHMLAYRRLVKGEGTLPQELLRFISPPPLESQLQQAFLPAAAINQDKSIQMAGAPTVMKEPILVLSSEEEEEERQTTAFSVKADKKVARYVQKTPIRSDFGVDRGKAVASLCKDVLSVLQMIIDKKGPQVVPLLTDLWKRVESSGYTSAPGNNLLDLRKIDLRVDRFEYNGVMEFVFDILLMLKSSMQHYRFSHEVRAEARKVHELFFGILMIAFPDTDFREARNAVSFSGPVSTPASAPSPRQAAAGQGKWLKQINETEPDPPPPPPPKQLMQGTSASEDMRDKTHISQKKRRLGSSSSQDQESSPLLTYPGDLATVEAKKVQELLFNILERG